MESYPKGRVVPLSNDNPAKNNFEDLLKKLELQSDAGEAPSSVSPLNFDAAQHGDQLAHPEHDLYSSALLFRNKKDGELYRKHMKKQVYAPLIIIMLVAAGAISIHTWFTTLFISGPWFILGFVMNVVVIFAFAMFILVQFAIYSKAPRASRLGKIADFFMYRALWGEYDSFICILATLALCFFLYGRVAVGECIHDSESERDLHAVPSNGLHWWRTDDPDTRWPLLGCNPEAAVKMPPQDSVMRLFLVPAVFQVCVKGASKYAALVSWCLSTACLIACAVRLDNLEGNVWVILYPSLFLLLAYENERFKMALFLSSKLALETAVLNERNVSSLLAFRDQKAKEKEQELLRSLIGNVAHDMKTPLQSLTMGLDVMRVTIEDVFKLVAQPQGADLSDDNNDCPSSSEGTPSPYNILSEKLADVATSMPPAPTTAVAHILMNAEETITNMEASCSFMSMSINRAIDFAKASRNIALVPKIESFDFIEVLKSQIRCVNNLRASSSAPTVVLDLPFTTIEQNIRKVVLSDKQWLEENMLCLLSNAVKYSQDHSAVKVSVSLEEVFSTPVFSLISDNPSVRGRSKVGDVLAATMKRFHQPSPLRVVRDETSHKKLIVDNLENENEKENSMLCQVNSPRLAEYTGAATAGGRSAPMIVDLSDEAAAGGRVGGTSKSLLGMVGKALSSPKAFLIPRSPNQLPARKGSDSMWTDMLRITVEDAGPGLSAEAMEKLFQPLKQGQRFTGGTGLGLFSLAKRADALGGDFGVTKRDDGKNGSLFWFSFPYRPDHTLHLNPLVDESDSLIRLSRYPSIRMSGLTSLVDGAPNVATAETSKRLKSRGTSAAAAAASRGKNMANKLKDNKDNEDSGSDSWRLSIGSRSMDRESRGAWSRQISARSLEPNGKVWSRQISSRSLGHLQDEVKEGAAAAATTTTTTAAATATAHMNGGEPGENSSSRVRVLVVDDSLTILRMVSRVLEGQGFVVDTAKNGQEALQKMVRAHELSSAASYHRSDAATGRTGKLSSSTTAGASTSRAFAGILCADTKTSAAASAIEELTYDVVLMDIQMPVMDGCEATRKYREHESLPEGCGPIVAVEESNLSSLVDTHSDARTDTYAGISTNAHPSPRCNRLGKKLLIIGMSANSDSETKRLAKEAGMDHFLEKPFVVADFMKLVRES